MAGGHDRAIGLRDAIRRGEMTVAQATHEALDRARLAQPRLNAFITIEADRALERARALDAQTSRDGALFGVPVAVKDNLCVRGTVTTAGSRMLEGFVAPYDATVIERLEAAGAVIIGKTNCDEFAMGSSTEHSAYGPTRNPWSPDRAPGGSSGGSAAAVAAGIVPLALGSDTGGSVRQPAAFCGVVGTRPTYGRVSRFGLIAFASSMDQVGPLARDARDAALLQAVIEGDDPRDATCGPAQGDPCTDGLEAGVSGLRFGVPRHLLTEGVDDDVRDAFERTLATLAAAGATIDDVTLASSHAGIAAYYLVATAEASANLARYDGVRYGRRESTAASIDEMYRRTRGRGFGAEVKRRLMLGTYALSAGYYEAFYLRARQVRQVIRRDFVQALEGRHALLLPTSPTVAFPLGERTIDPLRMYVADTFTVGPSLAGLPATSVPAGLGRESGLPVGLQIVARAWDDAMTYRVAAAVQREAGSPAPPL